MTQTRNAPGPVRRYYQLVDENDVDELVALFAADAVYRRPGYEPLVGHAALTEFYGERRVILEGTHILESVVVEDPQIAVRGRFRGVLRDGRQVDIGFSDFFVLTEQATIGRRDTYFFAPLV